MTVLGQKKLNEKKEEGGLRQDLKLFWRFLVEVPEGRVKKEEKKVLWRGKAWI